MTFDDQKFSNSTEISGKVGAWGDCEIHEDYFLKYAVVEGKEGADGNEDVEYCGYVEKPLGYDYEKDLEGASEYNESDRSVEDQEVWDQAENVQEAIEEVLNRRGENEVGVDFDKIKNERLKLLAESDFDLDFSNQNPGYGVGKRDTSMLDILGDLQSAEKQLKIEDPKPTATAGAGGFKGFKKKNVKKNITSIGLDDFNGH